MNVYVVVEGQRTEKAVYAVWIPEINPQLAAAPSVADVVANNFVIVSAFGYPQYLDVIDAAIADVTQDHTFDRLVVCVDSEDMTLEAKRDEIEQHIEHAIHGHFDYRVVVQHFCFETWALANRKIGGRNPQNPRLREYRRLYNVLTLDPEGLPALPAEELNRSQFAEKYLRLTLNDKNKGLSYSKSNPKVVAHEKYFAELRNRLRETGHIQSFQAFLDAFA